MDMTIQIFISYWEWVEGVKIIFDYRWTCKKSNNFCLTKLGEGGGVNFESNLHLHSSFPYISMSAAPTCFKNPIIIMLHSSQCWINILSQCWINTVTLSPPFLIIPLPAKRVGRCLFCWENNSATYLQRNCTQKDIKGTCKLVTVKL